MTDRYQRQPAPPPTVADLPYLLRDAAPTAGDYATNGEATVEARRAKAVHALLTIARDEVAKTGDPNRLRAMPSELREFVEIEGLRILLASDPTARLKWFLGLRRRRGRPREDNERRDVMIAADVATLVKGGMAIDKAYRAVDKAAPIGVEAIRKIYLTRRDTDEVSLASLTWREFEENLRDAPEGDG